MSRIVRTVLLVYHTTVHRSRETNVALLKVPRVGQNRTVVGMYSGHAAFLARELPYIWSNTVFNLAQGLRKAPACKEYLKAKTSTRLESLKSFEE